VSESKLRGYASMVPNPIKLAVWEHWLGFGLCDVLQQVICSKFAAYLLLNSLVCVWLDH